MSNAAITLSGRHRDARHYAAKRGVTKISVLPNAYSYRVKAPGYEDYIASDLLSRSTTIEVPMEPKPAQAKPIGTTTPDREYLALTLDHKKLTMAYQDSRYVKASALYARIPQILAEDVSAKAEWRSSNNDVVTVDRGVIKSGDQSGTATISAEIKNAKGRRFFAQCPATVSNTERPLPQIDFTVNPDQRSYRPNQPIVFTPIINANLNDYTILWFIGNARYATETKRHTFAIPGGHTQATNRESAGDRDSVVVYGRQHHQGTNLQNPWKRLFQQKRLYQGGRRVPRHD